MNRLFITLQTYGGCYNDYDMHLSYYPESQQVTHDLLQKFYHGLIFHRRFIMEVMLVKLRSGEVQTTLGRQFYSHLTIIANELEHNIARLYHLVSFMCSMWSQKHPDRLAGSCKHPSINQFEAAQV